MKSMSDLLLNPEAFSEIVMGNTALARAMVESGVRVVTSYPGSPTPEIAGAIKSIPVEKRPFYFEYSTNEKVACEVAFGASMNGHTACVFFKSVGLNVAADSFVQFSLFEPTGGLVIILGDDPGANSSQNEQDNRHFAELSYMPLLEPSSAQEAYELFKTAVKISRDRRMPVILRLTTHVCHAKQKINFSAYQTTDYDFAPKFSAENGPHIPITTRALDMKRRAMTKLSLLSTALPELGLNSHLRQNTSRGIITAGLPFLSLSEVLQGVENRPGILKLSAVNPLNNQEILDFLNSYSEVKILEELDEILARKIKSIAYDAGLKVKIIGKMDDEEFIGEYTPEKVYQILRQTWPDLLPERAFAIENSLPVVVRPAQLCPGCGHRSAFYAIKQALKDSDITVADIGCHTLGFLPPMRMGQVLLSMGHSPATAAGLSIHNKERKVVAFLGDSTFFHAAMPAIVNAIFNHHNFTLIILPNGTTAMTGHQDHPGTGHNFDMETPPIPIKQVLTGLGVTNIREVDSYAQKKLTEMVKAATEEDGFKVILASHPCMLKNVREQKRAGLFKYNKAVVDQSKCKKLLACVSAFACPAYQKNADGTISVNNNLCIGDGSCVQTCSANSIKIDVKK